MGVCRFNIMVYLCIMKQSSRKRVSVILKEYFKDKVFDYEYGNMRCQYKIKSVIPVKDFYEHPLKEFKLNVEVVLTETRVIQWDRNFGRVRDENGNLVYHWKKAYCSKTHAHRYNHQIRRDAKSQSIFKVFGINQYDIQDGTVKWLNY